MPNVLDIIKAHHPSIREGDDELITLRRFTIEADNADLAVRTCSCGAAIDGFDDFIYHLQAVIEETIE